ncbi:MAG: malate dehydrogenase [Chromatiales bacterium]|nr:malate dehydrogenase [Chromatiales bacterium]
MNKISIVGGAGRVGETTGVYLAQAELCRELMLVDVRAGAPEGAALDIAQSRNYYRSDTRVDGSSDPAAVAGSDLIVVTAGLPRQPGMSRSDVLGKNVAIIDTVIDAALAHAPDAMMLIVSNPVDVMTWRVCQRTGWARSRVIGQAGVLDAARMAHFIALETGFSMKDITTIVLGGHGDTMVPVQRLCTVNGIPVETFIGAQRMAQIIQRTRDGGAEVLKLRGNSSAYDAPAASVAAMVDAIAFNRRRIMPSVAILDGEYGQSGIAMGVPCVLGAGGIERVVELELTNAEQAAFATSAGAVREDIDRLPTP